MNFTDFSHQVIILYNFYENYHIKIYTNVYK